MSYNEILFSRDFPSIEWIEAVTLKTIYGSKGALLAALPRMWTPPFVLIPASISQEIAQDNDSVLSADLLSRIRSLSGSFQDEKLIVRSSVIGETIWDRGTYKTVILQVNETFQDDLKNAVKAVVNSTPNGKGALVIQQYLEPKARGEFGNLLRISKTRDHWELSEETNQGALSHVRFNTQRDVAADAEKALLNRSGLPRERLFGSIAAWLNNDLLRNDAKRLTCEWLTDNRCVYIVQLDEEDEDTIGVNPFQLVIPPIHNSRRQAGILLRPAEGEGLETWDKLVVLRQLWETETAQKPLLFFVAFKALFNGAKSKTDLVDLLRRDFEKLIGADNIIVRTSVRASAEKETNLPRSECTDPQQAADWCIRILFDFQKSGANLEDYAFIVHRFMAARASAWARADPSNPVVEIHSLWGLPDALQFCPYDIWEVHVPTKTATEYPEYKSNILIPTTGLGWEYARVKNELARNVCIGRKDAIDVATRSISIARRIGRPCHIMWFIGCIDSDHKSFNVPWYWTEAHDAEKNIDRTNYRTTLITCPDDLATFINSSHPHHRGAMELRPTNINLMRDNEFIESVGSTAKKFGVPVFLAGSTLAHAYFQLRRQGCAVVALGEKNFSRTRHTVGFGKLVRDRIPDRITQRRELRVSRKLPLNLVKGFLIGKLLEEALEVRNATLDEKANELADLFEVVRALAFIEDVSMTEVVRRAEEKRAKVGGFDEGVILMQTAIPDRQRATAQSADARLTQVLARRSSSDTYEIPFSIFGFMEPDQPRSLNFPELGMRLQLTLKSDKIEVRLYRHAEQVDLPLDLAIDPDGKL